MMDFSESLNSRMIHYGVWIRELQKWMLLSSGEIFWTTSKLVACAQLENSSFNEKEAQVRSFEHVLGGFIDADVKKV